MLVTRTCRWQGNSNILGTITRVSPNWMVKILIRHSGVSKQSLLLWEILTRNKTLITHTSYVVTSTLHSLPWILMTHAIVLKHKALCDMSYGLILVEIWEFNMSALHEDRYFLEITVEILMECKVYLKIDDCYRAKFSYWCIPGQ